MFSGIFYRLISFFEDLSEYQPFFAQYDFYFDFVAMAYEYIISYAVVFLTLYAFGSIGIYVLSKNNSVDKAWMSFVPFLRYVQLGRLVGQVRVFGGVTKNLGVFVAIFMFAAFVLNQTYDAIVYFEPCKQMAIANQYVKPQLSLNPFLMVLSIAGSICSIVSSLLEIFLLFAFFRCYEKKHPILYAILSIFLGISGIFIFVVRKNKKLDYANVYNRFYGQNPGGHYNGPYNGPYNGQNGPYNNPNGGQYDNPYNNQYQNPYQDPYGNRYQTQNPNPNEKPPKKDVFEEYADDPDGQTPKGDNNGPNGNYYDDLFN